MSSNAQPSGLELLVDEKKFNDLLAQQRGAWSVVRSGLNVLLFIGFLTLYTALALGEPLVEFRGFEGYVRRRFDTSAAMPLAQVESISTFWEYMHRSFVPGLYGNDTGKYFVPDAVVEKMLRIEGANRLYGTVRMRAVKTSESMDCLVADSFATAFPACYGPYVGSSEDTSPYGPVSSVGEASFVYTDAQGPMTCGKLACYGASGFMQALTSNYNESQNLVRSLEDGNWVSANARGIFIDFTVYNFNSGYYAVCKLLFEVAPSGRWVNTFDVQILMERHLSPLGAGSTTEWSLLAGEVFLLVLVLRYLLEEASEFIAFKKRAHGLRQPQIKMEYFKDAWNVLDWLNLIIIISTFAIRVKTWGDAPDTSILFGDPANQGVSTFVDYSTVAKSVRTMRELIAFNAVLTWFKAVKYVNVFPYISTLMQTVLGAQRQLMTWMVIFITTLFGFVLSFTFAFGSENLEFSTPWKTFVFLVRTILGDSDMSIATETAPLTGSLLIVAFVVVVFFTVMQLFISIMLGALQDAKLAEELKQLKQWQEMVDRAEEFVEAISTTFGLEALYAQMLPGLHSRLKRRKKKMILKELAREDAVIVRAENNVPFDDKKTLGPASPSWGRRKVNKGVIVVNENDESGSEPDLGPLRHADQLVAVADGDIGRRQSVISADSMDSGAWVPETTESDVVNLVLDATKYVADGVVERSQAARTLLLGEMTEAKDILQNINSVLEVLSRRARDIEMQQMQFTRHF